MHNLASPVAIFLRIGCMCTIGFTETGCAYIAHKAVLESRPVLDPEGPSSLSDNGYKVPAGADNIAVYSEGAVGLFERSYATALSDAQTIASGQQPPPKSDTDKFSVDFRHMAETGTSLVDRYCNDFFYRRGKSQTVINLLQDIVAATGTAATAVIGLASPANATAAGATALFTATSYNALDIYTRNFLFGADNIETVHTLVGNALAAHSNKVFSTTDTTPWTFAQAAGVIDDHQTICTPMSIKALALTGIKSGTVTAHKPAGTLFQSAASAAQDAAGQTQESAIAAVPGKKAAAKSAASAATNAIASNIDKMSPDAPEQSNVDTMKEIAFEPARNAALSKGASAAQADRIAQYAAETSARAAAHAAAFQGSSPAARHYVIVVNGQMTGQ